MNKNYTFLSFLLIFTLSFQVQAQRLTVSPGNITQTNIAGPFNTSDTISFSKYAIIYSQSTLVGILHGDTIQAIDFQRNGVNASVPGNSNCKIWISNTANDDFGVGNINFQAEILNINASLVFDGDPSVLFDSTAGFTKFSLLNKHEYDTNKGKNLVLFIEYTQDSFPTNPIFWNCDNNFAVPGFANNQVKFARGTGTTVSDTSTGTTIIHPQIRLDIPRQDYDGVILIPYTYGKLPVPVGNPDTIKLRITNLGKNAATGVKAYVTSRGANNFKDSLTIANLPTFEDVTIKYPVRFDIKNFGLDTLLFELPDDGTPLNNRREHVRLANQDVYSYRMLSEPLGPGGIGFNGGTGNFVCKFSSNTKKLINQIEVSFGIANRPFKIGIWSSHPITGLPDTLIWESDSMNSLTLSTLPIFPPVEVNGDFYTGVRQLGTLNVAFAYQLESPVRPQTFWYSTPLNSTNWIDFAPGATYRFMIEPRIQARHDLMVLSIDTPKRNDVFDYYDFDTIRPMATIYNLGATDVDTPVTFVCKMFIGNLEVLSIEHKDTIASGSIKQITFDTAFVPPFTGEYRMEVYPIWALDSIKLNDTAKINFSVEYYNDIGPDFIFSPFNSEIFEFKRDTVKPLARIRNYAFNDQSNFKVRARIISTKGVLVYEDSLTVTQLAAGGSTIVGFKDWPALIYDTFNLEVITELSSERTNSNDTLRTPFLVRKSRDVATNKIIIPADQAAYSHLEVMPAPKIEVINDGLIDEGNVVSYIEIWDKDDQTLYSDTQNYTLILKTPLIITFIDSLRLDNRGKYFARAVTRVTNDFETSNDTLFSTFFYGFERDAMADTILAPDPTLKYELNTGSFAPVGIIKNLGYDSLRNAAVKLEGIKDNQLFYISSRFVNLDSSQSAQVVFDNTLTFSQLGNVELRLITLHVNDQNKLNDTFTQDYFVQVSNDVGVDSILNPLDLTRIPTRSNINPSIRVSNYGLAHQSSNFDVNCRVLNPKGVIIYNEIESLTLDSAASKVIDFTKDLTLIDTGMYTILSRSQLSTDQFLPNDSKTHTFEVYYASNNAVSSIFPEENKRYIPHSFSDTIHPSITITKTGEDNRTDSGIAYMRLSAKNSSYIYMDSLPFTFTENTNPDTALVFNKTFDSNVKDSFEARVWISSKYDGKRSDDSLIFEFSVLFATDISSVENEFEIGPNPTQGMIQINTKASQKIKRLVLIDNSGKNVLEQNFESEQGSVQLHLEHLPDGIYFLLLNDFTIKISKVGNQ